MLHPRPALVKRRAGWELGLRLLRRHIGAVGEQQSVGTELLDAAVRDLLPSTVT